MRRGYPSAYLSSSALNVSTTSPIKQALYSTLMCCQLRLVALLYAALDVSCNKA
jgi:hypothetical protein